MWNQLKAQVHATDWQDLLPTICIQLITWSYAPFAYVVGVDGTHFTSHFGPLFYMNYASAPLLPWRLTTTSPPSCPWSPWP
ncbi:hypothetical protein QPX96_03950 [Limosilactobacillus fermentum]|nr:hypothetical protein [Limosilactobacillus fermentum]